MKHLTKVLLSSFSGATVITGIVAGTAIPVLTEQSRVVETQTSSQNPSVNGNTGTPPPQSNPSTNGNQGNPTNQNPPITPDTDQGNGTEQGDGNGTEQGDETSNVSLATTYKQLFETANSNGTVKKIEGQDASYKDPNNLTVDPNSANYFGNFYDPIIPDQLSTSGIVAIPQTFEIKNDGVIFYYNLQSPTISIVAKAVVHGFYKYPAVTNDQAVDTKWKPQNFNFLRNSLGRWPDQQVFDQFVLDHWNDSLLNDAINAYRYYFLLYSNNTTFLKKYIFDGFYQPGSNNTKDRRADWSIGYLIASSFAVSSNPNLAGDLVHVPDWKLPNGVNSININPTYVTSSDLKSKDDIEMSLKWELRNFIEKNYHDSVSWERGIYSVSGGSKFYMPFTVTGELKFSISKTKPTMQEIPSLPRAPKVKLAKQKITVTATVTNPNPNDKDAQKTAKVTKTYDFSILDALYRYVVILNGSTTPNQYPTPYFDLFHSLLTQSV